MKAITMMKANNTVEARANDFGKSIKRNIKRSVIEALETRIEKLQDKLYSLTDFSLKTDVNKGLVALTREECEKAFNEIIEVEYEIEILKLELDAKRAIFNTYFEEVKEENHE